MTPLTNEQILNKYDSGVPYKELAKLTGKTENALRKIVFNTRKKLGINLEEQKEIKRNKTQEKVAKKIEEQAEITATNIAKQFHDVQELNQLGINKAYELMKLGGEEFGTGMGALNLFASAVYRFRENVKAFQEYEGANNRDDSQESETNLWEMCSKALEPSEDEQ